MRIEHVSNVKCFVIYDGLMPSGRGVLDPITVILRDFGGSGQIIVECYGSSWSQWFGSIGSESLQQFIATCHPEYLSTKLLSTTSQRFNKVTEVWVNRIAYAVVQAMKGGSE